MKVIDRQQKFVNLAAIHANDFKTRVTQHDRENTFPFENIEALKTSGYLNMTLPAELGGGGANLPDFVMAQERLAQGVSNGARCQSNADVKSQLNADARCPS
jgi:alkylation response protein AidB-like acyl-CoA dehydrogenase